MTAFVPPATVGMLGGGQLGKYALMAANSMGYRTIVVDPAPDAPAGVVAHEHLVAAYDDDDALATLASRCDVITTEFENAPASALERLAESVTVAPSAASVAIAQDRIAEKTFLSEHGIAVGPFAPLRAADGADALHRASPLTRRGAIVKTARLGYDGKGQMGVDEPDGLSTVWEQLGHVDCVVEAKLDLRAELSVLVARSADGATVTWPVAENVHVAGILDVSVVPARVGPPLAEAAGDLALRVADALDYVGVLAVEMFVVADDRPGRNGAPRLLVNEIAPRPHNSGHWTLDACVTSQFEQQIRAACGVGFGATELTSPAVAMVNLLGDLWFPEGSEEPMEPAWETALGDPDAALHLYGKSEPRPGRKMGHLTVRADAATAAATRAFDLRSALTQPST